MLSKLSVKKPYTVLVAVVLVLILGVVSFTKMTPDLFPSMDLPYAIVMTTYGGASPEAVETTVTKPIEQSMATISNIENVSSVSMENMSLVILEFGSETNMDTAMIDMRENLDLITGYFPDSIGKPIIMKLNPDMMPVLVAAIDADELDQKELSDLVEKEIEPAVESVEGVGSVTTSGLLEQSVNVVINQDKIDKVNKKIKKATEDSFQEAEDKIADAKSELEAGKNKISSQSDKLNDTLAKANNALINGKIDVATKKLELNQSLTTLKTQITQLEQSITQLKSQKTSLESALKSLKSAKKNRDELVSSKEKLESQIEAIKNNSALSEEEKQAALSPLEASLKTVNTGIETIDSTLKAQGVSGDELDSSISTMESNLSTINKNLKELNSSLTKAKTGKKQIEAGLKELKKGEKTLNDQMEQMDSQKSAAQQGINSASAQLAAGEAQLNSSEQQLEEAKESALEQASLEGKISADMIKSILTAQNFSMPAGYITEENTDYLVRVGDKLENTENVEDLILMDLGLSGLDPITLKDVADVAVIDNSDEIYAKINGNNGIILSIEKQNNYATADVSERVQDKFDELTEKTEGLHFTNLMDQGIYINLIIDSVLNNILMGAVLAILILFVFLKSIKPTFIVGISIPISVILAIVLMYFFGISLNMISLSGLALGVGMLVDNSIVVIENIFRLRKEGMPIKEAAVKGATQVFGAICASTLTTVSVFLPIIFTEGLTRTLMADMALTIGFSLLASLVVAVTVVPAMAAGTMENMKERKDKLLPKFNSFYQETMNRLLNYKVFVVIGAIALMVLTGYFSLGKGSSLMPSMESSQMSATLTMEPGTELADTRKMADEIVSRIQEVKGVKTVGAMTGSGSMMGSLSGGSADRTVSMYILLDDETDRTNAQIQKEIEEKTKDLDCEFIVASSNMDTSALGESGISVQIKGKDLDQLSKIANDIAEIVEKTKGTKEVDNGQKDTTKELHISVNKSKAMAYGLTVAQVYQSISDALSEGTEATALETGDAEYTINIKDGKGETITAKNLGDFQITGTKDGKSKKVRVKTIATIEEAVSPDSITRENQTRYMTVSAAVEDGYNVTLVSQEIEKKLKKYDLPSGYSFDMGGEYETVQESVSQILLMLVLAIAFMYLIMVAQFQSLKSPFIILFTIPLAFTGGFIALLLCKMDASIIAMFGFIMLSGIIVNNGIVLVDYINKLREEGMEKKEAIIQAGKTRLRPIIMTALTTILGLCFMAAGVGDGSEMMQPMAVVTIGGLIYGTILTLVVIPCVYDLFHPEKRRKNRMNKEEEKDEITD